MRTTTRSKNTHSVRLLRSWLTSCSIKAMTVDDCRADLVLQSRDGQMMSVVVLPTKAPLEGNFVLDGSAIISEDLEEAFAAFHELTEAAGYGKPSPVNRGRIFSGRASYKEAPELICLRHKQFRTSVNPTPAEMALYEPVVRSSAGDFYRRYRKFCVANALDFSDLAEWCRLWTINFLSHFQLDRPLAENRRLLYAYLRQCFGLYRRIYRKLAVPDWATVRDVLYSNYEHVDHPYFDDSEYDNFVDRMGIDTSTRRSRRYTSKKILDETLAKMSHHEMVLSLTKASRGSAGYTKEAALEAARRLEAHKGSCVKCQGLQSFHVDNQVVAGHSASA